MPLYSLTISLGGGLTLTDVKQIISFYCQEIAMVPIWSEMEKVTKLFSIKK